MRYLLPIFLLITSSVLRAEDWKPEQTSAVIVGILQWQNPGLDSFSAVHRKDQELYNALLARGIPPSRITLLLDAQATRANILTQIRNQAKASGANSTFIFYYAGHGLQEDRVTYAANYDIDSNNAAQTGLRLDDIYPILAQDFKGTNVILMGDFCYSGALKSVAEKLGKIGKNAAYLTSSAASNESTGNWTFSQTIIDCLNGFSFCDRNHDGKIELGEIQAEVASAMKNRERQLHGFGTYGLLPTLTIALSANRADGTSDYAMAPYNQKLEVARIITRDAASAQVEFYFYSDKVRANVASDQLKKIEFKTIPASTRSQVIWGGKWYPAKVLESHDGFHHITYEGYDSSWDEWVMADRILDPNAVMIEWDGKWYPGVVQKKENGKFLVRYDGYGAEWDEWVGANRLKFGSNQK